MIAKKEDTIATLREAGRRLARVMDALEEKVERGVTPTELDSLARRLIEEGGDKPAFLNYKPQGASYPYPASLCTSVNDEVVHGIPSEIPLVEGDIIGLDLGLIHNGVIVDMARTLPVGKIDAKAQKLLATTQNALMAGIKAIKAGKKIGDISAAIETVAKEQKYGVVRELGGHGVGKKVHEPPFVPNFGKKGTGDELVAGLVIAIEPMFNEGSHEVVLGADGYTYHTADGKRSAHFEHTILVTKKGAEIITA